MKTLTDIFTEIIEDVGTKYQVESTVVWRLIEAVKERDEKLDIEGFDLWYKLPYDGFTEERGHYFFETKILNIRKKIVSNIKKALEKTRD